MHPGVMQVAPHHHSRLRPCSQIWGPNPPGPVALPPAARCLPPTSPPPPPPTPPPQARGAAHPVRCGVWDPPRPRVGSSSRRWVIRNPPPRSVSAGSVRGPIRAIRPPCSVSCGFAGCVVPYLSNPCVIRVGSSNSPRGAAGARPIPAVVRSGLSCGNCRGSIQHPFLNPVWEFLWFVTYWASVGSCLERRNFVWETASSNLHRNRGEFTHLRTSPKFSRQLLVITYYANQPVNSGARWLYSTVFCCLKISHGYRYPDLL